MLTGGLKSKLLVNATNIPGWRTNRKIVVLESDDWGSVRIRSSEALQNMMQAGLNCDAIHYDSVDGLESNTDLKELFNLLGSIKDSTNRPAVFTPMVNVANPDFDRIQDNGFKEYVVQPLEETLKEYPNHDRVLNLWKEGIAQRLFVPGFHGREHLNIPKFMSLLQEGHPGMMASFQNRSYGIINYRGKLFKNYLDALHPDSLQELENLKEVIQEGGRLFEKYCGYKPVCFMAPNAEEPKSLEPELKKIGIRYLTRSKRRRYPIGDGTFKTEFNWLGKRNAYGQLCIVRNCFFEPVTWGEHFHITNWVDNCLKEIEIAFRWGKPAVISTHRANYVGGISHANREKGLTALGELLMTIMRKWPETEFMTTAELGDLIAGKINPS